MTRLRPSPPRQIGALNDNGPGESLTANQNEPARVPSLVMIGNLPLVVMRPGEGADPATVRRLARREERAVGDIGAAQARGDTREAARLAIAYEQAQGVTRQDRAAALRPVDDTDRKLERALGLALAGYAEDWAPPAQPKRGKRPKGRKKPKVAAPPSDGFQPGDLRQDEIDRLEKAELKLKSRDPRLQAEGRDAIKRIERARQARIDNAALRSAREEIRALEEARGGIVEDGGKNAPAGQLIVRTRDGLETMRSAGALDGIEYAAGLRYRADREMQDPERSLTPPNLDPAARGKVVHGGDGWAQKQAEIAGRIRAVHRMIAGLDPDPSKSGAMPNLPPGHPIMQAIWVLEEVAGKGRPLSDLSRSGSVRARLSKALKRALGEAAIVYGLE